MSCVRKIAKYSLNLLGGGVPGRVKRIMFTLIPDGGHRAVPRTDNCFVRQAEDLPLVVFNGFLVMLRSTPLGATEEGVPHNSYGHVHPMNDIGYSTGTMTTGEACFHLQVANGEKLPRLKGLCAGNLLCLVGVDFRIAGCFQ